MKFAVPQSGSNINLAKRKKCYVFDIASRKDHQGRLSCSAQGIKIFLMKRNQVPNFSQYRNSTNLLERAAYYAVQASWIEADDFTQAQEDANELLFLAKKIEMLEWIEKEIR